MQKIKNKLISIAKTDTIVKIVYKGANGFVNDCVGKLDYVDSKEPVFIVRTALNQKHIFQLEEVQELSAIKKIWFKSE